MFPWVMTKTRSMALKLNIYEHCFLSQLFSSESVFLLFSINAACFKISFSISSCLLRLCKSINFYMTLKTVQLIVTYP